MDLLFQDIVVTAIASAAMLVLIQRVRGLFFSSRRKSAGCEGCPKCEEHAGAVVSSQVRT